ncbi:site-2 protease family protein [Lacisediminimonas sp.]|uniref:site-2 protease family protein n=1 Tax=Lacisediminimonas sp. TaxID=3060582 RepID=UPI0027281F16|nr:site-2 protease family protein [Lacisediminimonas sp.]MDO8299100.1 site-2 protease family protein [Lacisediminimonas sp.]MDO9215742.1 site-2 protease family protein [Lacisediminimonas sp.]
MNDMIQTLAVYSLPILFAITLHEAAHAYAARYFGDNTAWALGRMSLNPIKHVDLFGTIIIPILLFLMRSPFLFGWAKPVPVDFSRLRNPKKQMAFVALAGPLANLVMGLGWLILLVLLRAWGESDDFFLRMARAGVQINLVIFAFNLIPLPPLDGGRIMTSLLPTRYAIEFAKLEPYGFFIVLGLAFLGVLSYWMVPVMGAANALLLLLISPLTFLLG